jgi:hypothetical protein
MATNQNPVDAVVPPKEDKKEGALDLQNMTDHDGPGQVSGGPAPAAAPRTLSDEELKAQQYSYGYEKPPIEERVPDENNGPQIGETYDTYMEHAREGTEPATLIDDTPEPPEVPLADDPDVLGRSPTPGDDPLNPTKRRR